MHRFVTYDEKYAAAYRDLNIAWIEKYFRVEQKDVEQVNHPQDCRNEGGEIFFVLDGDEAVGTCAMYKTGEDEFELAKMAVRPTHQGLGLGDVLMEGSERWAREQGAREILILSNTKLEPAIRLYHKHGFETVHLGPNPDYERCNIEMRKRLT